MGKHGTVIQGASGQDSTSAYVYDSGTSGEITEILCNDHELMEGDVVKLDDDLKVTEKGTRGMGNVNAKGTTLSVVGYGGDTKLTGESVPIYLEREANLGFENKSVTYANYRNEASYLIEVPVP